MVYHFHFNIYIPNNTELCCYCTETRILDDKVNRGGEGKIFDCRFGTENENRAGFVTENSLLPPKGSLKES